MTRPAPLRLPALLVTVASIAATLVWGAVPARAADDDADVTPLRVSIDTLAPGTIPRRGPVTLTGRITNRSEDTWSDLNVYLLTSAVPLSSRAELADAAASDADTEIGERVTTDGLFAEVGDLAPGTSVAYRLSVPRDALRIPTDSPGVYWVGVHVLGANTDGRDVTADGRARTFMPQLPTPGTPAAATARTRLALLVPVKKPVQRGSAGRVVDTGSWADTLGSGGRLRRLLSLSGRARRPITWVVDPAVLDAVQSLSRRNPTADPAPGAGADPTPSPTPTPSTTSSQSPAASTSTPSAQASGGEATGTSAARTARRARSWLDEFRRQAPTHTVTTVPYGDLDVASALQGGMGSVYRLGTSLSDQVMTGLGVRQATPVVDPSSGYLPQAALQRVDPQTPVVLRQEALPGATRAAVRRSGGPTVVLTDTDAEQGGPAPNSQFAALSVRQRLLSEAALHALSADRGQPLVVSMPDYWNPGEAWNRSRFFGVLDTSWLTMVDLPSVAAAAGAGPAEAVSYPEEDRREQLPQANLQATRSLVRTAGVFDRLLTAPDPPDQPLDRIAMLASSGAARADPDSALRLVGGTTAYVTSQMAQVRVEGPQFVMMSGESGPIQVTLVNGLSQSVTVGVTVSTPGSAPGTVRIDDVRPVTLGAGRRTSIRLQARSDDIGVHAVSLTPTDADGVPLGTSTQLNVRTSNVSTVIWVIMAVGGGLLFVAIAIRLLRRVRLRRATHGPRLPRERGA